MSKTNLQHQIFIDALPSKVWKVLTSCDYINQYLLDGLVQCQWVEGGSIVLMSRQNESTETISKGKILKLVPGVLLKYSLEEQSTSGFTTITYELIPAGDGIELKFHSDGFTDAEEHYFFRLRETKLLLQKIKWLAEYA